jgi:outer membrane protein assembly factor BamD (BamD/ComL family)
MYARYVFLYFVSASMLVTPAFLLPVTIDSLSLTALAQTQTNQNTEARKAEADRLYQQAIELLRKRQLQSAVEKFQEALVIYQQIQDYDEQRVRYLIGSIYEQLGQSDRAQKYYPPETESLRRVSSNIPEEQRLINEEFNQIAREIKKQVDRLYQQGIQQLRQDQLQQALQTFQQVLAIHEELGFGELSSSKTAEEKKVLYQIASVYEQLGESEQAENIIREAETRLVYSLSFIQDVQRDDDEDPKTRADRLFKEGSQQLEKGELSIARIKFEQVLGIRKRLGDRKGQTEAFLSLAKVHERLGNKNWAEQFYRRAREIGLR